MSSGNTLPNRTLKRGSAIIAGDAVSVGALDMLAEARIAALLEKHRAGAPSRPSRKAERETLRAEIAAHITQEPQVSIVQQPDASSAFQITVRTQGRLADALDAVGKSDGVFKLTNEAPHCSADGR